ncbi:hypothetical protein HK104_004309, partial [Borealophlyctis nickersoniae]
MIFARLQSLAHPLLFLLALLVYLFGDDNSLPPPLSASLQRKVEMSSESIMEDAEDAQGDVPVGDAFVGLESGGRWSYVGPKWMGDKTDTKVQPNFEERSKLWMVEEDFLPIRLSRDDPTVRRIMPFLRHFTYFDETPGRYRDTSHDVPTDADDDPAALSTAYRTLFAAFAETADHLRLPYWLSHGTLLGWHWGRRRLPWDNDLDVQISARLVPFLTQLNGTRYGEGGRYLLDVSPFSMFRLPHKKNRVD